MPEVSNPLVSSSKTSDSRQTVQLHPLVLLTVSDYITRHTLQKRKGPVVGAILGAQHGRDISMEHAFECKTEEDKDGAVVMNEGWFDERLKQFRDVHKAPALDLVGWFTLTPVSGPQQAHLAIHRQLAQDYNESVLFLAFHPSSLQDSAPTAGDKLPITVYEPVYEAGGEDGDKVMESSGETPSLSLKFRELPYNIETGDAEMIGVDFVAKGSANATAIPQTAEAQDQTPKNDKGKTKAKDEKETAPINDLTKDEEDLIATLEAKANAVRMLQQRISLIKKYLQSLPACYLTDPSIQNSEQNPQISHSILRSITSLLARLPLIVPYTPKQGKEQANGETSTTGTDTAYKDERNEQSSDVDLIKLLGELGNTIHASDRFNKQFSIYESEVNKKRSGGRGFYDPVQESMMDMDNGDDSRATGAFS